MDANCRFYRLIRIFAAAWALSVAVFWLFCRDPQMAMLHVIVVQYLFLPALTVLLSFFLGREGLSIPQAGYVLLGFSAAYLLCRLLTLSLLEYLLSGAAALPGLYDVLAILSLPAVGLLIGAASKKKHLT
mgnify:FL=1